MKVTHPEKWEGRITFPSFEEDPYYQERVRSMYRRIMNDEEGYYTQKVIKILEEKGYKVVKEDG